MARALFLALLLLGTGALGYFWGSREPEPAEPERVTKVRPSASVITALKRLARLEGATLHLERVIDLRETQSRLFGLIEAEDAILLVAAGNVTAGIDLSHVAADDIRVDASRKRAEIALPRAEIFSVRLDTDRTYVHTRVTDTLAERQIQLESKARQEAVRGFHRAATEANIEQLAEQSVARTVRALVGSLGFDEVVVTFSDDAVPERARWSPHAPTLEP